VQWAAFAIWSGACGTQKLVGDILPTIVNRKVLYLGLLLHDIAKGRKEDHSIAGMKTALTFCPRLGFTPGETQTVGWLSNNILLCPASRRAATHRRAHDRKIRRRGADHRAPEDAVRADGLRH